MLSKKMAAAEVTDDAVKLPTLGPCPSALVVPGVQICFVFVFVFEIISLSLVT